MKTAGDIAKAPGLNRHEALRDIALAGLEGLPLSGLFAHPSLKGDTLFFVFKHQGALAEFEYKKEDILKNMRTYYKQHAHRLKSHGIVFARVAAKARYEAPDPKPEETKPFFKERSSGDFEIHCTDPKLKKAFESIQNLIRSNRENK